MYAIRSYYDHQANSRLYTDIGLMTANEEIGEDLHKIFQQLSVITSYSIHYTKLYEYSRLFAWW